MLLIFVCLFGFVSANQQAVAVKGKLMCGAQPAHDVQVKLWDEDDGPDPDDLLMEMKTNADGSFELRGSTSELTSIDPVLKIYHDCDDGVMLGQRKVKMHIPAQYIQAGGTASKVMDIGILNLETIFPGEERNIL